MSKKKNDYETETAEIKEFNKTIKTFAYWKVGDEEYRLKLKTGAVAELERKYKTNLINLMGSESGLPALSVMLDITYYAMKDWKHGIKYSFVESLFDDYVDEGGSQLQFFTEVFCEIYTVSGFFSRKVAEEMNSSMMEAKKKM